MAAPAIAPVPNAQLDERSEHYPREVAEQVNGGTTADDATLAGQVRVHKIVIADAASSNKNVVVDRKCQVIDVVVHKIGGNGAASNTYTVGNGANAITDAIDGNINDTIVARAGAVNDANRTLAKGDSLRVTWVKSGGNVAAEVFITVMYVA